MNNTQSTFLYYTILPPIFAAAASLLSSQSAQQIIMSRVDKVLSCIGLSIGQAPSVGEENAALRSAANEAHAHLLGASAGAKVEVDMWLSFSQRAVTQDSLSALNATLLYKTYLVGNSATLADFSVLVAVSGSSLLASFPNVVRWFNHIRSLAKSFDCAAVSTSTVNVHTLIPVPVMDGEKAAEAAVAPVVAAAPVAAPVAAPAAPAAAASSSSDKKKDAKPKAAEKAPAAAVVEKEDAGASLDPTKLDIRCGKVLKCWNHPDSEKLLCEEIDMGGGDVRTIASGIRAFYSAEEVQGRIVMVLCNLKERSIAGFKSQGMVLCAVSPDHSVIRLLEGPEGAQPGDRVTFPGFPADSVPATPAQMVKKKILEGLAPGLRTDSAGVAHWGDSAFTIGSGVCIATGVPDAVVS